MALEAQRFLHAANIRLDVPVSVQSSEPLTDELRLIYEDATLTSFEFLIQACIAQKVDFLLLSGNVFIEADRSLRARLALLNGMRQLESHRIRVFVIPGDGDPGEAWRAIPEMPGNVSICYSSSTEPVEMVRKNHVITTISASMWYGETDSFGIQVIAESEDGVTPFRIGVISQSKYEESLRMAAMASTASEDRLAASLQNTDEVTESDLLPGSGHGKMVPLSGKSKPETRQNADVSEIEDEESVILPGVPPKGAHSGDHRPDGAEQDRELENWDAGFVHYADEMLREGRLNYLVMTGTLRKATLHRPAGLLHCPGTTQPRVYRESTNGTCSLVEVTADGSVRITEIDTSTIDWKDIEIHVTRNSDLSSMLQTMKNRLMTQKVGLCDRIWSVNWTLRCTIPVLRDLLQQDLNVAVAVELDELRVTGRTIRLMHSVRMIPIPWQIDDPRSPAVRFQDLVSRSPSLSKAGLQQLIMADKALSAGWKQRFSALLEGVDPEQILGRMRTDGAGWFIPDDAVLTDSNEFEESGDDDESESSSLASHRRARNTDSDDVGDETDEEDDEA